MIKNLLLDKHVRRAVALKAEPNIRLVSFEPEDVLGVIQTFRPQFSHGNVLVSASLWNRMQFSSLWPRVFEVEKCKWRLRSGSVGKACGVTFFTEAIWPQNSGLHWMAPNQAVFLLDDQVVVVAVRPLEIGAVKRETKSNVHAGSEASSASSDAGSVEDQRSERVLPDTDSDSEQLREGA